MHETVFATPGAILPLGVNLDFTRNNRGKNSGFNIGLTVSNTCNKFDSLDITYLSENFDNGQQSPFTKIYGKQGSWMVTKFDTLNKIISGTFNFTLGNQHHSVVITDGRFDFQLHDLCKCSQ